MPHGELLIRTHKATVGRNSDGYVDAYDRYGLSLADGAMSQLLMPPGNKEAASYGNILTDGVAYLGASVGVIGESTLSLEAHICADSMAGFLSRLELFRSEVLSLDKGEFIRIKTKYHPGRVYRVLYQNFQQFSAFNMEMAKFVWVLKEPHPELRDVHAPEYEDLNIVGVVNTDADLEGRTAFDTGLQMIVLHPEEGHQGNEYLRWFDGDMGQWREEDDHTNAIEDGEVVINNLTKELWLYTGGEWRRHWY